MAAGMGIGAVPAPALVRDSDRCSPAGNRRWWDVIYQPLEEARATRECPIAEWVA